MEHELSDNVLDHTGEYSDAEAVMDTVTAAKFRKRLRELDPRFDVVYFGPEATAVEIPNRFYIVRTNELTVPTYYVVQDEKGEFCVPDQRHIDKLMEGDLWSRLDVADELRKARDAKEKAKEKKKAAKSEEFQETLLERLGHVYDTHVAIPDQEAEAARKQRAASVEHA